MRRRSMPTQAQKNNILNYFSPGSKNEKNKTTLDSEKLNESDNELETINKNKIAASTSKKRCLESDDEFEIHVLKKCNNSELEFSSQNEESHEQTKGKNGDHNNDTSLRMSDVESNPGKTILESFTFNYCNENENKKQFSQEKIVSAKAFKINEFSGNLETNWLHNQLDFLSSDKIRDLNKNRPGDSNYDPRTLYVPEDFLNKQTPAMRQWWILKSRHMDSVLFFKVGKFYELYHMDAVIGVNYLGFSYMKGEFAHSGFPESAYGRMANALISQGFKVARVEQTETPEMMAERCKTKKSTKFDKVVNREICQITTKATCIYGAQMTNSKQPLACYMIAITEKSTENKIRFGVCFIDTSIGTFHLAEFNDDLHYSKLLALLAEYPPRLILLERGCYRSSTLELLKKSFGNVTREMLTPKNEFYTATVTLEKLSQGCYFLNKEGKLEWPSIFKELMLTEGQPKTEFELCLKALGACIWYLKDCKIDIQILSMGKFEIYESIDYSTNNKSNRKHMVLDSVTVDNLKLLGNIGSLQKTLDFCSTAFGKRLLQHWICRPLCNIEIIKQRQEAVKELYENSELLETACAVLLKIPDLERQIAKIHMYGNRFCATTHPDSRAIFYEAKTYSKRKIFDLINTLNGFKKAQEIAEIFNNCKSKLLLKLTQRDPFGMFIDLNEILQYFDTAFDRNEAENEGRIIPQAGVDSEYDSSQETIKNLEKQLQDYLHEQQEYFGCNINYVGNDKKRFQLEVPENKTSKVTSEYHLEGTRKGQKPCRKYSTSTSRNLLAKMIKAETERAKIIQDLNRRIFEKFSERQVEWEQVLQCLSILDVLCALAKYAKTYGFDVCIPKIEPFVDEPKIEITCGRHPCIINVENFVPNDTFIGGKHQSILLLTGPNMGGKSTLMRQISLIIVMAQIGSFVPATSCKLNLIDRIFTRLGAHDDIIQGQSTFLVELSEASSILQHATKHSLVLLDELGRGTSTHDGNAIATAFVKKLIEIKCRTLFSTHYHSLVDYFTKKDGIQLKHMACIEEDANVKSSERCIIFLYKLAEGKCPHSYGFNVARLAGLNKDIIKRGTNIALKLELVDKNCHFINQLFRTNSPAQVYNVIDAIKKNSNECFY